MTFKSFSGFSFCFQFKKHRLSVVHTNTYAKSVVNMADLVSFPGWVSLELTEWGDGFSSFCVLSCSLTGVSWMCWGDPVVYWLWFMAGNHEWKWSELLTEVPTVLPHAFLCPSRWRPSHSREPRFIVLPATWNWDTSCALSGVPGAVVMMYLVPLSPGLLRHRPGGIGESVLIIPFLERGTQECRHC